MSDAAAQWPSESPVSRTDTRVETSSRVASAAHALACAGERTPHADAISTHNLSVRFGQRWALRNVSIRMTRGTTLGLIGLNGAGKSTWIRAALGLLAPSDGSAAILGHDLRTRRVEAMRSVGYVPDRPTVYPWMRVEQAVRFAASFWRTWNNDLALRLLNQYRLDPRQKCGKLSKGQGAKLSLLLALAHEPEVLVLDEPTDGLDPVARDEFLEEVLAASMRGREAAPGSTDDSPARRSVLISSHALGELQNLTDEIAVLHEGRLLLQAPTEELLATTRRVRAVVESDRALGLPASVPGMVCQRVRGREWLLTVRLDRSDPAEGERSLVRALERLPGVSGIGVERVTLDELFKDLIRGEQSRQGAPGGGGGPGAVDRGGTVSGAEAKEVA